MREQQILIAVLALLAAAVGWLLDGAFALDSKMLIMLLLLACLIAAKLLLQLFAAPRILVWLSGAAGVAVAFYAVQAYALPFIAVLLVEFCLDVWLGGSDISYRPNNSNKLGGLGKFGRPNSSDRYVGSNASVVAPLVLAGVSLALLCAILKPEPVCIWMTLLSVCPMVWCLLVMQRLQNIQQTRDILQQQVHRSVQRLEKQRQTIGAVQRDAQLEERSRLASKIHDKLGHGVTGSILSLEAALVLWDNDSAKAQQHVIQVTNNLRQSVDAIRTDLRAERSQSDKAGLSRLTNELALFEQTHGVITKLEIDGSLDTVTPAVWVCLYFNLMECLTNLLKHSNAKMLRVSLTFKDQLLRAEFADNGTGGKSIANVAAGTGSIVGTGGTRSARSTGDIGIGGTRSIGNTTDNTGDIGSIGSIDDPDELAYGIGLQSIAERCLLCGGRAVFKSTPNGFRILMTFTQKGLI